MEKFSTNFITLLVVIAVTVLGVSCDKTLNPNCSKLQSHCKKNVECCSENCRQSFFTSGYCDWDDEVLERFDEMKSQKSLGMCAYKGRSADIEYKMLKRFGINGAYNKLPPFSVVEVVYNDKKIMVTINDLNTTDNVLELSEMAAINLGIGQVQGDNIECNITLPESNPFLNVYVKTFLYLSAFSASVFAGLYYYGLTLNQ